MDAIGDKVERAIVTCLVQDLAKAGYDAVKVWDGEEYQDAETVEAVLAAVFAVDQSTIHFQRKGKKWGITPGVFIVCGNGEDCISDWHCEDGDFDAAVSSTIRRGIQPLQGQAK